MGVKTCDITTHYLCWGYCWWGQVALGNLRQSLLLRALACLAVGSLAAVAGFLATLEAGRLHQITKHNNMPKKASPLARGLRTPLIDGSLGLQMYGARAWCI